MIGSKRMPAHKRKPMNRNQKAKGFSRSEISGVHPLLVAVVVMVVGLIVIIS